MSPPLSKEQPLREIGIVKDFDRIDKHGTKIGHILTDFSKENLYFASSEAPSDITAGQLVTFERGVFKSDSGNFDKAIAINHLAAEINEPSVRKLCGESLNQIFWSLVAADHLASLDLPSQIIWLKSRFNQLSYMPITAWDSLNLDAIQDPQVWNMIPTNLRIKPLENAKSLFLKEYLSAERIYKESPASYPPHEEFKRLKLEYVSQWVKKEIDLPLDKDQAAVVAAVGDDIQVIARAGSGKTGSLVARAIFLQNHCSVGPEEILLLAFNKKAAKEVKERLEKTLKNNIPHVMTFHALAHAIVHPEEELIYDNSGTNELGASREVQKIIDEHIRSTKYGNQIKELMLLYFRDDWERIENGKFSMPMEEFLEYRRSLQRETLNGDSVKSYGEKLIANILFEHDIEYKYESNFNWSGVNYRPDFMIKNTKNGGIIIEYFGLIGETDYDKMIEDKREFWSKKKEWKLLEYRPSDIAKDGPLKFTSMLLNDLKNCGIKINRLPEEEIWQRIQNRAIDSFTKAMKSFIGRCRKLYLSKEDLQNKISGHNCHLIAENLFLLVGQSIYSSYIDNLIKNKKEDFDGLMWRAVKEINDGGTKFSRNHGKEYGDLRKLRYIMVDEFQDFSEVFLQLLQSIRKHNQLVEFFCVGDDWQAINGFAGSNLKYFENFHDYFPNPVKLNIKTNHRSVQAIVNVGNSLMEGFGVPARSRENADKGEFFIGELDKFKPTAIETDRHINDDITPAILRLVSNYLKQGMDVVILSRINGSIGYSVNYKKDYKNLSGIEKFREHILSFFPETDQKRIEVSTSHKFKGLDKPAVIIIDALERRYPLIHNHWIFMRLFGDSVDQIVAEERRLFYVALTRAKKSLTIITESNRKSKFLENVEAGLSKATKGNKAYGKTQTKSQSWGNDLFSTIPEYLDWNLLTPIASKDDPMLEIQVHYAYKIKDDLIPQGYKFNMKGKYWSKTIQHEGFEINTILNQEWAKESSVKIMVFSETGTQIYPDKPNPDTTEEDLPF